MLGPRSQELLGNFRQDQGIQAKTLWAQELDFVSSLDFEA